MILKKKLIFLTFLIFVFFSINIAYSIEADIFVQSTVNRASEALNDKFSKEEKIQKLKNIAKETVDIKGIGFYTLGSIRKELTKEQIEEYSFLFEKYFLKSFASRLAEYSNPEIEVISKKKINDNYTKIIWGFDGRMEYPMNIISLFMNMDSMLGPDLRQGLINLKEIMEK